MSIVRDGENVRTASKKNDDEATIEHLLPATSTAACPFGRAKSLSVLKATGIDEKVSLIFYNDFLELS